MKTMPNALVLEVEEIERRGKPGCNSSSTSPLCTCPVIGPGHDAAEARER